MKEIEINSKVHGTHVIQVDDEDYEELSKYKWILVKSRNTFYAQKHYINKFGKRSCIQMHRFILGLDIGELKKVDHINGNGLNNQKFNLRACTNTENMRNRRIKTAHKNTCTSRYKGVYWCRASWRAEITFDGRKIGLGCFPLECEEIAGRAYDLAAIKYYGEFACLNFPDSINKTEELNKTVHEAREGGWYKNKGITHVKKKSKYRVVWKGVHVGYFSNFEDAYNNRESYRKSIGEEEVN